MWNRRHFQSIGSVVIVFGTIMVFAVSAFCPPPRCVTYEEINTYWADPDPAHFLQCRPALNGTWYLQQMPCGPGTLFSYDRQVCVLPANWTECSPTSPPLTDCEKPRCVTYAEINTLWVHKMAEKFYQCRPEKGIWIPQEMPCAPGTLFSFKHQVCVHPSLWKSSCD